MTEPRTKIRQLPTARKSPETVLHQVLEDHAAGRVQAVAVLVLTDDGLIEVDWSSMRSGDLAAAALTMNDYAQDALRGEYNFKLGESD